MCILLGGGGGGGSTPHTTLTQIVEYLDAVN